MTITGYDFAGWATKNNIRCADGRTILQNAFIANDGQKVPLVWNHQHDRPEDVLGHALLENHPQGVRMYGFFNDTESGVIGKALVQHGDIEAISIYANQLDEDSRRNVKHGQICEVSLVHRGANPGAYIDDVIAHGADEGESAIIYTGEPLTLSHAAGNDEEEGEKEEKPVADEKKEKTVKDVFDTLNEEQKNVVYALIGSALEANSKGNADDDDDDKEDEEVKHNIFENDNDVNTLSHSDMQGILADAKRCGSLREAVNNAIGDGVLMHSIDTTGMDVATGDSTYGFNDPSMLFPEYRNLNNPPEWISRNMDWVQAVLGAVHHTPFSRIKSQFADITEDAARAKGYMKGNLKKEQVFSTLKRTTDPQTIYKKQKLDRDDIIDITDFDVVAWIRAEMRVMLNEEIARAILIGDGREADDDDKIQELHVRPIVSDVPLFNIKHAVEVESDDTGDIVAKKTINEAVRARKEYKGSGNPTFFTTEDVLTEMLLLEDGIGHKLYKSEAEVATAMRASKIVTVEPMEGYKITVNNVEYDLIGVLVNLTDYNVGADKGGEINMFDDFDIDYNQQKYLIETRISGALTKPFSAITLYKKVSA